MLDEDLYYMYMYLHVLPLLLYMYLYMYILIVPICLLHVPFVINFRICIVFMKEEKKCLV